jgi:hypothetical protein
MLTILIIAGIVVLLLVVLAVVPFGDSGVSRAKENGRWSGANGTPRLHYDPEKRFKPPPDGS